MPSPGHRDGTPYAFAPDPDGASLLRAVATREATHPEFARQNQYGGFTVLTCGKGNTWPNRTLTMASKLREAKT